MPADIKALEAELRAGLGGLPKGPWRHSPWHIEEDADAVRVAEGWILCSLSAGSYAAHIARCSPENIAALLDTIESQRAAISSYEAARETGWRAMDSAPKNRSPVILAVPSLGGGWIVAEAYFDPEHPTGGDWWWAGTDWGDYHADSLANCNHFPPQYWQPLPSPPLQEPILTKQDDKP